MSVIYCTQDAHKGSQLPLFPLCCAMFHILPFQALPCLMLFTEVYLGLSGSCQLIAAITHGIGEAFPLRWGQLVSVQVNGEARGKRSLIRLRCLGHCCSEAPYQARVHIAWSLSTRSHWQHRWEMPSSGNREADRNWADRFSNELQYIEKQAVILDTWEVLTHSNGTYFKELLKS